MQQTLDKIQKRIKEQEPSNSEWNKWVLIDIISSVFITISPRYDRSCILLQISRLGDSKLRIHKHRNHKLSLLFTNKNVSIGWIASFVLNHAKVLKNKYNEQITKNKSIIKNNIKSDLREDNTADPDYQEIPINTPLPGSTFGSSAPKYGGFNNNDKHHFLSGNDGRDETYDGPLDDDWDSSDWERYMSGPNW